MKRGIKKGQRNLTIEDYKKAIVGSKGILGNISVNLGVTRQAVSQFISSHPELREDLNADRQRILDQIEEDVFAISSMETKDPKLLALKLKAAEKTLSSLGAARGWATVTKQETTVKEDEEKLAERVNRLRKLPKKERDLIKEVMGWTDSE